MAKQHANDRNEERIAPESFSRLSLVRTFSEEKFDESKHPRKDDGKFGTGGGSGKKSNEIAKAEKPKNYGDFIKPGEPGQRLEVQVPTGRTVVARCVESGEFNRYTKSDASPMSLWGHAMFVNNENAIDKYSAEGYGGVAWGIKEGTPLAHADDLSDVIEALVDEEGIELPDGIDSVEELVNSINPLNIVDSAFGWDDDKVTVWMWENVLEPAGLAGVETSDGAIVFDENAIERVEHPNPQHAPKPVKNKAMALHNVSMYAEEKFDESKHPRKDDGKFGSGGGSGGEEQKTVTSEKHGTGNVLTRDDLAKRQPKDKNGKQGYGGFPLDTINKVHEFSGETGLKAVIFRKDRNGKEVQTYQYTDDHMQKQADYKFAKAVKTGENIDHIRKRILTDSASSDKKTADTAVVTRLIDTTTIRVGGSDSEKDTGSVGATTLRAEHVIKNSDGSVNIKFPGKSHKEWDRKIEGDLAQELIKRTEGKQPGDKLFSVSASDVNSYLDKVSPDKITAKDFRTFHASSMCFDVLSKSAPPPKISAKEADANIKKAIEETSKFLGNTPAICKEKYINPRVIDAYRNRVVSEAA